MSVYRPSHWLLSMFFIHLSVSPSIHPPIYVPVRFLMFLCAKPNRLFRGSRLSLQLCGQKNEAQILWDTLVRERWRSASHFPISHWLKWISFLDTRDSGREKRKRKNGLVHCLTHCVLHMVASATEGRDDTMPPCNRNGHWIHIKLPFLFCLNACPSSYGMAYFIVSSAPPKLPAAHSYHVVWA